MLVLIVGPSGAGKDTLLAVARGRLDEDPRFRFVRRVITRPLEAGAEQHEPSDIPEFLARRDAGGFALHWEAHDLRYGIPAEIALDLKAGRVVVASVSRGVLAEAASRFPVRVIEITAPAHLLAARLAARGREAAGDVLKRLARTVRLPEGLDAVTIVNDGTVAAGAAKLIAALTETAGTAPRS